MARADCTVRALATAAQISYELADSIAADAGRVSSRGFKSALLIDEAKSRGMQFRKLRFSGKTLGKFLRLHPTGRYYLSKVGHAFAVVDGTVSDDTPIGSIVRNAWELRAGSEPC